MQFFVVCYPEKKVSVVNLVALFEKNLIALLNGQVPVLKTSPMELRSSHKKMELRSITGLDLAMLGRPER